MTRLRESLARAGGSVDELVSALAKDLSSPFRFCEIADTLEGAGREREALVWLERGLRAFPPAADAQLRSRLIRAYLRDGQIDDAVALAEQAFATEPRASTYRELRGHSDESSLRTSCTSCAPLENGRGGGENHRMNGQSADSLADRDATTIRSGRGVEIVVRDLRKTVGDGRCVLHDVSFSVQPGELVAIVGGSGAGKTTLLEALAGVRPADSGRVLFDGSDLAANLNAFRSVLGYVPQDDIIHAELPLERTLKYAARLRLPSSTPRAVIDAAVMRALRELDLSERAAVRVGALSGGQRKRASIAVELLTDPHVFFLDEPTSGLDPSTGAELLRVLRKLADGGATVVFTTHTVQDLARCDRVLFLAKDGHLAFYGTPAEATTYFEVERVEEIYERLATDGTPEEWGRRFAATVDPGPEPTLTGNSAVARRRSAGFVRQWTVLSRRTFETLARNRLTLAILLGSPAMVVAMFAVLFRPNAFDRAHPSPNAMVMIGFWIAFGAFFFGLTYGLLQVVSERAIIRREHLVGQRLSAYLLSKVTVLIPFLLLVVVLMLAVLRGLNRLPAGSAETYLSLGLLLALEAAAALTLGLLASAAVSHPSQATLALPMLCFPAVLFSGAILPVHVMAGAGAAISTVIPVRWAFEGIGHALGARTILLQGDSPLGPPLVRSYGSAGTASTGAYLLDLALFSVVFLAAAWATLLRGCRRNTR